MVANILKVLKFYVSKSSLSLKTHDTQKYFKSHKKFLLQKILARDNDWHVYKIIQMNWNTKVLDSENLQVTDKTYNQVPNSSLISEES